ncbi:WD domain G-beta repeat [Phytophthora infestans]|uniref:WD domain G-beta repeat n=1 Tax=Phytophthora infestans TaxID=4787 RepID=A0A833WN48_PHYIN|nr:WD domain G-beta repeat [Phytophthora infestans]KAF4132939.1 WD domain G-beta repeat domain-containing protein [Phytophthora infestans]
MVVAARAEAAGVAGDAARESTTSRHGKDHLRLLPPSANWYCSKICDWGRSDEFGLLFAFGAKNSVFIYQVTSDRDAGVKVSFFAQLVRGKRDRRVTAVQFLMDTTGELRLVCGGEEGSVQIWDVASLTMIEQHKKHKAEVMAVTVSATLDANFVIAGDRQGRISAWERDAGKVTVFMPVSGDGIHSMAISPHDKALVAVGYRSGVLCLVDAARGSVRHRLDGHDQEVQCVAWKPTNSSITVDQDDFDGAESDMSDRGVWLASSSRDKTIKVWKITSGEEPALEQVLRLPMGKQGMSFTQTKQLWLPVAWSLDDSISGKHCLWSGSFDGSLFRWEWDAVKAGILEKDGKNRRAACKPVVVKGGHSRMIFTIAMVPLTCAAESDVVSMLTVSLDRELRLWKENGPSKKLAAATCIETLTGLGGHAYSVSYNAATGLVAAGVGDQTIRLWDLNTEVESGASDYQCDLLWKGLQSKVTFVRWHPLQHSVLAYGMEDGRIGIYDIQTKKYNHFRTTHSSEVRQLQWVITKPKSNGDVEDGENAFLESIKQLEAAQAGGQSLEEALIAQEDQTSKKDAWADVQVSLWSCDASGHLFESNADAVDQKSLEITDNCVAFKWDEQCEMVAIGRSNGAVELMETCGSTGDCNTIVRRFHEHLESVTCVAWSNDLPANLLASGGQDGRVFVYNCGEATSKESALHSTSDATQQSHVMVSHSNKITCLRWSIDIGKYLLASASADGTVQVWNTTSMQREAHFNQHIGRVLSLDWVSHNTLITGGEDQTLRLWDYRKQKKEAASKLKKHGKVKQPQQVEPIAALSPTDYTPGQTENGQVVNTDRLHDPQTDKSNETSNKQKKKKQNMLIFHRETNLTSMEVASACSKIAGVKQDDSIVENTDTVDANMPVDSLLAHIDHTSLRDFFTSESKRFQDEREWESLANTLLIQGNIIEALRVVAKEGALTPTWLSYAPMAGMDVWREMTNLYAHQLDVQGDKKEAALHFLSIGKVRSAVACLVSGEAFREALALIRSRLGPNDALLHNALWKYSDFLIKRGRNGEAALALLQIGSVKAKARAVNTLVNTADIECVKAALDVLMVSVQRPAEPAEQDHKSDTEELAFPASFFLSIAGNAVTKSRFDVAETAGQLLQSPLVGSSSASHRLTGCLLSIVKAINEHQLSRCKLDKIKDDVVNNQIDSLLLSCAPTCVREFFEFLTTAGEGDDDTSHFYDSMVSASAPGNGKRWMASRADKFWFQVLDTCRRCGYWFDADGEVRIQEAQDLLVEANCFSDIEQAVAASKGNTMPSLLQVAQKMLRFVIDVMSTSFIGALEHMREVLQLLTKGETSKEVSLPNTSLEGTQHCVGNLQVNVMTLLQPCGFASPNELPQCGELAEEQLDTLVLWTSVLLSQCQIALAASISTAKRSPANSERNLESMIRSLLHLLTLQFFDGEAAFQLSRGLMDAGNQSQIGELMNEILVAIHHLPEEPATQEESCDNASVEEGRSSKQALLIDANDMRSRLTWSEDDMKQ